MSGATRPKIVQKCPEVGPLHANSVGHLISTSMWRIARCKTRKPDRDNIYKVYTIGHTPSALRANPSMYEMSAARISPQLEVKNQGARTWARLSSDVAAGCRHAERLWKEIPGGDGSKSFGPGEDLTT